MLFEKIFTDSKVILTEGALVERLKTDFHVIMDDYINHAGLIYSKPEILETLYKQYISIAQKYNLPILLMTPTRKVNFESIRKTTFHDRDLLYDSCYFLYRIKKSHKEYSQNIMIGGLLGCKGDAYSGVKILDIEESYVFHRRQTTQFQKATIDFLFAGIMPEINEAIGMAKAMAESGIPYIISFMIRKDGCLMDGTILSDAIKLIDEQVNPNPICYMANCIHPTNLIEALNNERNRNSPYLTRFKGIQANASILTPEELNNCNILQKDDFNSINEEMYYLYNHSNLKIFGGCCGTDENFMEMLSKKLISTAHNSIK